MQMNGVLPNGLGDEKGAGAVVHLELEFFNSLKRSFKISVNVTFHDRYFGLIS